MNAIEMARKFNVSEYYILNCLKRGDIPAKKSGGRWEIPENAGLPEGGPRSPRRRKDTPEAKRYQYIADLKRNAVTRQEKIGAYILWNEGRYTVQEIAKRLGLTNEEVIKIYDDELERMERVIGN